jgi:hypothetical protein
MSGTTGTLYSSSHDRNAVSNEEHPERIKRTAKNALVLSMLFVIACSFGFALVYLLYKARLREWPGLLGLA